jgi:hypothetical protein
MRFQSAKFTGTLLSTPSVSGDLSVVELAARLKASLFVEGGAEFGSRVRPGKPHSVYDLLILAHGIPARVFQMVTIIDECLADIVLVDTETTDALLAQKMRTSRILYDALGGLAPSRHASWRQPANRNSKTGRRPRSCTAPDSGRALGFCR